MEDDGNPAAKFSKLSVLVVEDEIFVALDIETMLEENGFVLHGTANTVERALRLLDDGRPDVAILDANLDGQPVTPVAEYCLSLGIPFILASAYETFYFDHTGILDEAENIGKPILPERLIESLKRAVAPL